MQIFFRDYLFIYLFILKIEEVGGERGKERNINVREKHQFVASCMHPDWGLNPKPRYVP